MVTVRRGFTCVSHLRSRSWVGARLVVLVGALGSACDGAGPSPSPAARAAEGGGGGVAGSADGLAGTAGSAHVTLPEIPKTCGNGTADPEEACDDGNRDGGDGCDRYCQVEPGAECPAAGPCNRGNGMLDGGEDCDDGNATEGDGCTALGKVESGWVCAVAGRTCRPLCGDGTTIAPETCDDGNPLSGDGCGPDCRVERACAGGAAGGSGAGGDSGECAPEGPYCGDGHVDPDEACDDGLNDVPYSWGNGATGCAPGCALPHYCGDGILDGLYGESCDFGSRKSPACELCHAQGGP